MQDFFVEHSALNPPPLFPATSFPHDWDHWFLHVSSYYYSKMRGDVTQNTTCHLCASTVESYLYKTWIFFILHLQNFLTSPLQLVILNCLFLTLSCFPYWFYCFWLYCCSLGVVYFVTVPMKNVILYEILSYNDCYCMHMLSSVASAVHQFRLVQ